MGSYQNGIDIQKLRSKVDSLKREICCLKTDFCERVDDCLGIAPSGQSDLFLNQQGEWVSAGGGGGGCCDIIEVTIAEMQTLISNGTVEFPATYRITDLGDNGGGIFTSASTSSLNPTGTVWYLTPPYAIGPVNKGQLLPSLTVNVGERYCWGNTLWDNATGVNTPPTNDFLLPGPDWVPIFKSVANGYILQQFAVEYDAVGGVITKLTQPDFQNSNYESTAGQSAGLQVAFQFANSTIPFYVDNNGYIINNRIDDSSQFLRNINDGLSTGFIRRNEIINGALFSGNLVSFSRIENNIVDGGNLTNNVIRATSRMSGNTIRGNSATAISHIVLEDNCTCNNNIVTGDDAAIWDVHALENGVVDGNTVSGERAVINNIYQTLADELYDNILSGTDSLISQILMLGEGTIHTNTLAETNSIIERVTIREATINNFTINSLSGKTGISNIELYSGSLTNGTDFNINNCYFSNINIDFTGWSRDIENETIEAGKGVFSFTHDFGVNPVTAGNSVYYGFIPNGSVGTRITLIPDSLAGGIGATLEVGVETDDTSYGIAPTVLGSVTNTTVVTLSNATTGQRSIALTAGVQDITGGTLKVTFEFIV